MSDQNSTNKPRKVENWLFGLAIAEFLSLVAIRDDPLKIVTTILGFWSIGFTVKVLLPLLREKVWPSLLQAAILAVAFVILAASFGVSHNEIEVSQARAYQYEAAKLDTWDKMWVRLGKNPLSQPFPKNRDGTVDMIKVTEMVRAALPVSSGLDDYVNRIKTLLWVSLERGLDTSEAIGRLIEEAREKSFTELTQLNNWAVVILLLTGILSSWFGDLLSKNWFGKKFTSVALWLLLFFLLILVTVLRSDTTESKKLFDMGRDLEFFGLLMVWTGKVAGQVRKFLKPEKAAFKIAVSTVFGIIAGVSTMTYSQIFQMPVVLSTVSALAGKMTISDGYTSYLFGAMYGAAIVLLITKFLDLLVELLRAAVTTEVSNVQQGEETIPSFQ